MEKQRNWQGWAAIVLAGLALLVALGGRFDRSDRFAYPLSAPAAPAAPAAPQAPGFGDGRFERGEGMPPHMREMGRGEGFGPGRGEFGPGSHGFGRGFGPLGMIFGLIGGLIKLAAFGMLAWLLLRLFQQRRQPPPMAAGPTTPAGHDPRVE